MDSETLEDVGCCGRLTLILRKSGMSCCCYLFKWFIPFFAFAFGFLIQNILLHVGTYFYVQWMLRLNSKLESGHSLSKEDFSSSVRTGALHDLGAQLLGDHDVSVKVLDGLALLIPSIWFVAVVNRCDLQQFTKCCFCGAVLAITKGIFAVCTVMPDSTGWDGCKARLGPTGVAWFSDPHNMNFEHRGILTSMKELLHLEVHGTKDLITGKSTRFRFCADMVYSGHTYFAALFATALYDFVSKAFYERSLSRNSTHCCLFVFGFLLMGYVLTDATLILMNRFHYTIDVLLSLLIVFLFYTNPAVARVSAWWANEAWIPRSRHREFSKLCDSESSGDVMVHPCCCWPPFCCFSGRYMVTKPRVDALDDSQDLIMGYLRDNPEMFVEQLEWAVEYHKEVRSLPDARINAASDLVTKAKESLRFWEANSYDRPTWTNMLVKMGYGSRGCSCCPCCDAEPDIEARSRSREPFSP